MEEKYEKIEGYRTRRETPETKPIEYVIGPDGLVRRIEEGTTSSDFDKRYFER